MTIILLLLAIYGTFHIVGFSQIPILIGFREKISKVMEENDCLICGKGKGEELFGCPLCLGFWVGLAWSVISFPFPVLTFFEHITLPLASSAFCCIVFNTIDFLINFGEESS